MTERGNSPYARNGIASLIGFLAAVMLSGCAIDQSDLVFLNIDSPAMGVSLGIRGRVSESADPLVGARLVIDSEIDDTSTKTFVMPLAQMNVHF